MHSDRSFFPGLFEISSEVHGYDVGKKTNHPGPRTRDQICMRPRANWYLYDYYDNLHPSSAKRLRGGSFAVGDHIICLLS